MGYWPPPKPPPAPANETMTRGRDVPRMPNGDVDWGRMFPAVYRFDGYTTMGVGDKTWFRAGTLTFKGEEVTAREPSWPPNPEPSWFRRWIDKPLTKQQFICPR